jgi:integrase/recombinase XerD
VARLINDRSNLFRRALIMMVYGTGMRRSEVVRLRVHDIDSECIIIRVLQGKCGKDRDLPLSLELLETLRAYLRWRNPKVYLFLSRGVRRGPNVPLSDKTVCQVCTEAARKAGITRARRTMAGFDGRRQISAVVRRRAGAAF